MTAIALKQVEDCIEAYPPGGTRKTFFVRVKKFLTWAWREQYTATNLMAGTKSADNWRDNTEKMDLETFGAETLEPGDGHAWFAIRPWTDNQIIQMVA